MSHSSLYTAAVRPILGLLFLAGSTGLLPGATPLWVRQGSDLQGGGRNRYGDYRHGEQVNYVYAESNGALSSMETTVSLTLSSTTESTPLFLHIRGRDDDSPATCPIRITLNDRVLYDGPSDFSSTRWEVRRYPIPSGILSGTSTLVIRNTAPTGKPGVPPWFMVAACAIGPADTSLRRDISKDFRVDLPKELRPFPEPLPEGATPGFSWRGTKGWLWKPDQYLALIPELPKCRMNFLMNCYGSMCDIENVPWGDPRCNRWYEPLPPQKKQAYEKVVEACRRHGITFCFSMNPNLSSSRFVRMENPADVEALWQHYAWMQGLGVRWFNISLDDISQGIDARAQARVVNEFLRRLRARDPEAQMIFCPTFYWGDGTERNARPYLETLARELQPDVWLFWTGSGVVGPVSRRSAESYKSIVRHRLFLWDNYPVNDGHPTMHLGPVVHRDPDLNDVIDGYMANPHHTQNRLNLIPTYTCGDYAWNPRAYDPERSVSQAILHLESSPDRRQVLRDMVEAYPGMLAFGSHSTGFNAVRERYTKAVASPHSRPIAQAWLRHLEDLAARFERSFPSECAPEKATLRTDIDWIRLEITQRYGSE